MFRFLRITLILWLLSVALIGGAALYGRAHAAPNELQALGFSVCEGRPCFMGITPGVTIWDEALLHLQIRKMSESYHATDVRGGFIQVVNAGKGINLSYVGQVSYSYPNLPILSSFFQMYGQPCRVKASEYVNHVLLIYPSMEIRVRTDANRFTLHTPIAEIDLYNNGGSIYCHRKDIGEPATTFWLGFTSLNYYEAHGLELYRGDSK